MATVICPKCGEAAEVVVNVADGEACACSGCGEAYTVADVRAIIASWGPLLAWLDSHPAKAGAK